MGEIQTRKDGEYMKNFLIGAAAFITWILIMALFYGLIAWVVATGLAIAFGIHATVYQTFIGMLTLSIIYNVIVGGGSVKVKSKEAK